MLFSFANVTLAMPVYSSRNLSEVIMGIDQQGNLFRINSFPHKLPIDLERREDGRYQMMITFEDGTTREFYLESEPFIVINEEENFLSESIYYEDEDAFLRQQELYDNSEVVTLSSKISVSDRAMKIGRDNVLKEVIKPLVEEYEVTGETVEEKIDGIADYILSLGFNYDANVKTADVDAFNERRVACLGITNLTGELCNKAGITHRYVLYMEEKNVDGVWKFGDRPAHIDIEYLTDDGETWQCFESSYLIQDENMWKTFRNLRYITAAGQVTNDDYDRTQVRYVIGRTMAINNGEIVIPIAEDVHHSLEAEYIIYYMQNEH